jgi:hypothetical protein
MPSQLRFEASFFTTANSLLLVSRSPFPARLSVGHYHRLRATMECTICTTSRSVTTILRFGPRILRRRIRFRLPATQITTSRVCQFRRRGVAPTDCPRHPPHTPQWAVAANRTNRLRPETLKSCCQGAVRQRCRDARQQPEFVQTIIESDRTVTFEKTFEPPQRPIVLQEV